MFAKSETRGVRELKWVDDIAFLPKEPFVMICALHIKGSVPVSEGAKMFVTPNGNIGSIGGGKLEYEALRFAKELCEPIYCERTYTLSKDFEQCCGGFVSLSFVYIDEYDWIDILRDFGGANGLV